MSYQGSDMHRREVLGALGCAATVGSTGCITREPVNFDQQGVRIEPGEYYSYRIEVQDAGPARPRLSYTVTGDEGDRFDVLVFTPGEFGRYREAIEGRVRTNLDPVEDLSRGGVNDSEVSHTEIMPEDEYELVVDHTNVPEEMVGFDVNPRLDEPVNVDIEVTVDYPGITDLLPF